MPLKHSARRQVLCQDAIAWLKESPVLEGHSAIASLPDVSELSSLGLEGWKSWFIDAAALLMSRIPDDGVSIFFQTDIKVDGAWVDKGLLCQKAGEISGAHLLWHKIVCRVMPGNATFGKPAYSHLMCFSRGVREDIALSTPDVLPDGGAKTWTRGMGKDAALFAARWIQAQTRSHTIIDPFCGHGMSLAAANHIGLDALGIELGKKRADKARSLSLDDLSPEATDA